MSDERISGFVVNVMVQTPSFFILNQVETRTHFKVLSNVSNSGGNSAHAIIFKFVSRNNTNYRFKIIQKKIKIK